MKFFKSVPSVIVGFAGGVFSLASPYVLADVVNQTPAQLPLVVAASTPPLNMLVVGRDHKLFFPAYNDASDLDGDGIIDIHYKPAIDYYGYFDSHKCYSYNGTSSKDNTDYNGYFVPVSVTTDKTCVGSTGRWSGDYLNYLTTSRVDALRKVLYGGYRSNAIRANPENATPTILERTYIRADAHTWGKQYKSVLIDGYNISSYTPLGIPDVGNYTLFANTNTALGGPPRLRIAPNQPNGLQIYGWVSREVTEGQNSATTLSGGVVGVTVAYDFNARVQVCASTLLESNCVAYPNGNYKPTGLLHDYGQGNQMYFGLMTGTYQNNISGGALRKAISSFTDEVDPSTGIFGKAAQTTKNGTTTTTYTKQGIISTLDSLRISDPNLSGNYANSPSGSSCTTDATCINWGNPMGEILYESLRYFSGATTPTPTYASGAADTAVGLSSITSWIDPYSTTSGNTTVSNYPSCSKPFNTIISDVNPSDDSALPGNNFGDPAPASNSAALSDLNVSTLGQTIWTNEFGGSKSINIGQSGSTITDNAPTAKTATSFGTIRGLPEEPTKSGTYNTAMVAYYGNTHPITSTGKLPVKTFAVALSSTLPKLQIPVGAGSITIVPYGRALTVPATEELTGFYIESMYNMPGSVYDPLVNNGLPKAVLRVVYDDADAGADYDQDATIRYTFTVNGTNNANQTLTIDTFREYQSGSYESHMGYTISGSTADGIYLEVTGGGGGTATYALDTPGALLPGACAVTPKPSGCTSLSGTHTRTLIPSTTSNGIQNLQNPLWYAAKWGGFGDFTNTPSSLPANGQWNLNTVNLTADKQLPDNYFLVTNANTLKNQLSKAFSQITQTGTSISAPAVVPSTSTSTDFATYTTNYVASVWSGDLIKTSLSVAPNSAQSNVWNASAKLPAWGSRNILMANASANLFANSTNATSTAIAGTGLQAFTYNKMAGLSYGGNLYTNTLNQNQVDFLRGDTTNAGSYRNRASLIGDIVNSAPQVVSTAQYLSAMADTLDGTAGTYAAFKATQTSRRAQVYVGANDGMLHAFDAATGVEKFAFVPTAVIPRLSALTSSTYNTDATQHRYFVDGTPVISDVYFGNAWHTVLIGTLGAGGSEIFALDITDPDNISLLWEFTSQSDTRLGATLSTPLVAKLHDGHWGVIVGNGYNSNNGTATLFVLNAATGKEISALTASTPSTGNNGLSSPVIADIDSDGVADYVYAGDLLGNVWRFDLFKPTAFSSMTAAPTTDFKVAFGGSPLYTATVSDTANSAAQSITTTPTVVQHPSQTGVLVIFGTGRFFTTTDKTSTDLQTLYGIWDKTVTFDPTNVPQSSTTPNLARSSLQAQTISTQVATTEFGLNTSIRLVSTNAINWATKYGWYMDLKVGNNAVGERVVDPLMISGSVLFLSTRTPSVDSCQASVSGWTYGLNPFTGGATDFSVFDLKQTGTVSDDSGSYKGAVISGFSSAPGGISLTGSSDGVELFGNAGNQGTTNGSMNGVVTSVKAHVGPSVTKRQTWRNIPVN